MVVAGQTAAHTSRPYTGLVNHRLSNVLSLVVLAVVGVRLVQAVKLSRSSRGRSLSRQVWTRIRWRHIWPVPIVLTGVLLAAFPLLLVNRRDAAPDTFYRPLKHPARHNTSTV